jgi:hypothetical protein
VSRSEIAGKGSKGSITRLRLQHTGQHRISRDSSSSDRSHGTLQRAAAGSVVRELAGAALQANRGEGKERREFGQTLCCEEEDCECHGFDWWEGGESPW